MFDQDAEETFERSGKRPMDHHRTVILPVGGAVLQIEASRQHEIDLHRPELP